MSSENSISDAAEGATKGVLEWSADKISQLVQKLKDKKLAFIEEKKTIDVVKEQYNSAESHFYKKYIKDKELLFLVRMGLTLRKLEYDEERVRNLRDKILRKYNLKGLHIAEFVQNGVLNRYIGILLEKLTVGDDLEKNIAEVLNNIDQHAIFIQGASRVGEIVRKSINITDSHSPSIFVIAGVKSAVKILQDSLEQLKNVLEEYELERFASGDKEILFFRRRLQ